MTLKNLFLTVPFISLTILGTTQVHAAQTNSAISDEAKNIIGKTAVEYLKNNPEAFAEVVNAVQEHAKQEQEKQQAAKLAQHSSALFNIKNGTPFIGNKNGSTEVVVFMDPFCHYCRKFEETLREAVKSDKNLKIIARDIAIMHEKSLMLIKANVAAANQGKYPEMQSALHKVDTSVSDADVLKMAADLKLDMAQFKKDMNSKETETLIKNNMDLADGLDISATPTFIIKKSQKIISGYVPFDAFQELLKG